MTREHMLSPGGSYDEARDAYIGTCDATAEAEYPYFMSFRFPTGTIVHLDMRRYGEQLTRAGLKGWLEESADEFRLILDAAVMGGIECCDTRLLAFNGGAPDSARFPDDVWGRA